MLEVDHVRNGQKFGRLAHYSYIELSILSFKLYQSTGIGNGVHKDLASLNSEKHIFLSIFPHAFSWEEYVLPYILVKNIV